MRTGPPRLTPLMNPEPTRPSTHIAAPHPPTESLVDLLEEAIIVAGRDGTIIEWNNGATRVFGWTPDEAQGMSIQSLQSAEAARGLASAVQQVFASQDRAKSSRCRSARSVRC